MQWLVKTLQGDPAIANFPALALGCCCSLVSHRQCGHRSERRTE